MKLNTIYKLHNFRKVSYKFYDYYLFMRNKFYDPNDSMDLTMNKPDAMDISEKQTYEADSDDHESVNNKIEPDPDDHEAVDNKNELDPDDNEAMESEACEDFLRFSFMRFAFRIS
jgi:hypothetical protein